jgi:uncharacterized membrane protein
LAAMAAIISWQFMAWPVSPSSRTAASRALSLAGRAGAFLAPARDRFDRAGLGPPVSGVAVVEVFFPFVLVLLLVAMMHLP